MGSKMQQQGEVYEKSLWYHEDAPRNSGQPRRVWHLFINADIQDTITEAVQDAQTGARFFSRGWPASFRNVVRINLKVDFVPGSKTEFLDTTYRPGFKIVKGRTKNYFL
jgi:hypothetical protein